MLLIYFKGLLTRYINNFISFMNNIKNVGENMKKISNIMLVLLLIIATMSTLSLSVPHYGKWKVPPSLRKSKGSSVASWYIKGVVDGSPHIRFLWWCIGYPNNFGFHVYDTVQFKGRIKSAKACLFAKNCKGRMSVTFVCKDPFRHMTFYFPIFYIATCHYKCVRKNAWLLMYKCRVTIYGEGYTYTPKPVIVSGAVYVERVGESLFEYEQIKVAYAVNGSYVLILVHNFGNRTVNVNIGYNPFIEVIGMDKVVEPNSNAFILIKNTSPFIPTTAITISVTDGNGKIITVESIDVGFPSNEVNLKLLLITLIVIVVVLMILKKLKII